MGKYFHMTKIYLVLVTVFILTRFGLEVVGPEYIAYRGFELEWGSLISEISVTRLFLVLPVFLGLRFVRESLGGLKEMFIANFIYVFWGGIMLVLLHGVDDLLVLGTHYGRGAFIGNTSRTIHFRDWMADPWRATGRPTFASRFLFIDSYHGGCDQRLMLHHHPIEWAPEGEGLALEGSMSCRSKS